MYILQLLLLLGEHPVVARDFRSSLHLSATEFTIKFVDKFGVGNPQSVAHQLAGCLFPNSIASIVLTTRMKLQLVRPLPRCIIGLGNMGMPRTRHNVGADFVKSVRMSCDELMSDGIIGLMGERLE